MKIATIEDGVDMMHQVKTTLFDLIRWKGVVGAFDGFAVVTAPVLVHMFLDGGCEGLCAGGKRFEVGKVGGREIVGFNLIGIH